MGLQGSRTVLVGTALLLLTLPLVGIVAAQDEGVVPADQPAEITINIYMGGGEDDPFDIQPDEIMVPANSEVTFHVVNLQPTDHDFGFLTHDLFEFDEEDLQPGEGGQGDMVKTPILDEGESYDLNITIPPDVEGTVEFICTVPGHDDMGMRGVLHIGEAVAEEEEEITEFGVSYLAYWVGIVSLILMVLVLVGTFFLFRYGETRHAVDHRTGGPQTVTVAAGTAGGEDQEIIEPVLPSPKSVVTVLVIIALIGALFYFLI